MVASMDLKMTEMVMELVMVTATLVMVMDVVSCSSFCTNPTFTVIITISDEKEETFKN